MNRAQLADFLRTRREALQPEDVGLPRGPRRRTGGLRREEVAALCGISADYYGRIEQQRGPRPSEQMIAALARGLRLGLDERDHLFRLAGHLAPERALRAEHVAPGLMRIMDRLADTPAQVMTALGETLVQTRPAQALLGDETRFTGPERACVYRWFTRPESRRLYPEEDHGYHGRVFTAQLRDAYTREGPTGRAAAIVTALEAVSSEFVTLWAAHDVGLGYSDRKRIQHPEAGVLQLYCQTLVDPANAHVLLVFTAAPGSESAERLELLSVVGQVRSDV
ncbi:helix-turn-helix transcriptional regulator [Dactylosporangium matsuzakiense]|uniref:Transcriptional regulator n=1 Tax=Dactylosporangium matsuzakiense TaxID=53360 RepID=A0A9W6NNZ0_9ACTN|nr:helix-turn-helix transcriptional regulator [Dactylosporangium matsuzakiense]UWZ42922.1 helix-turn-helix domain-containing protein [Dactylosporangium matsuzakiense]GLL03944.1 transcriptional regulator [Dactylosporangium matsuzakiense]